MKLWRKLKRLFRKIFRKKDLQRKALEDFNRIVADLPHGIHGIGNNVNPVIEAFRALRRDKNIS
jgi:hypothetical protein